MQPRHGFFLPTITFDMASLQNCRFVQVRFVYQSFLLKMFCKRHRYENEELIPEYNIEVINAVFRKLLITGNK